MGWGVGHVRMDTGLVVPTLTVGAVTYFGSDAHDTSGATTAWTPRVCWLRTDGAESVFLVGYEVQSPSSAWHFRVATVDAALAVTYIAATSGTTSGAHRSLTRLEDDTVLYGYEPAPATGANSARRIITVSGANAITIGSAATWPNMWQFITSAKPARSHFGGTKLAYVYTYDSFWNIYWRLKTDADTFVADADWWNVHEVASPAKLHYDPQIIDLGTADDGGEDSLITWLGVGSDNVFEFGACGVRLYPGNTQWRGTPSLFNVTLSGSSHGKFWSVKSGDYQALLAVADQTSSGNAQGVYSIEATLDPDDMSISWSTLGAHPLPGTWGNQPRMATRPDYYGALVTVLDDDNGFYYGRSLHFNMIGPADPPTFSFPGVAPAGNPTFDNIFETDIAIDPNTGLGLYVANEEEELASTFGTYCFGVPFKVGA